MHKSGGRAGPVWTVDIETVPGLRGVWVVDIDQAKVVSWLKFEGDVNEIFAVDILTDCPQAEIVQSHEEALDNTFVTPSGAVILAG